MMDSGKIVMNLALCLLFWGTIVLLLLLANGKMSEKAIATPIAAPIIERNTPAVADTSIPDVSLTPAQDTPPTLFTEITGEIRAGESFEMAMKRLQIAASVRSDVIKGFSRTLDFRQLQPGDRFTLQLDQDHSLAHATYASGILDIHILKRHESGTYLSTKQPVLLQARTESIAGLIESSLYAAFIELGEHPKLIHAFADIFASKIDFNTETRSGDTFKLLVEKFYKGDIFVGYGRISFARYQAADTKFEGYFFASDKTPPGYFDAQGEALGTWFIRSPIPLGRVTSRFTMRRKHPIDGVVRPHLGVDLAAPRGTPVMATAAGQVKHIGRKGGFGKTIILRHNGGYETYYGHLSGYRQGLSKGSTVAQKDIIGYVGSTGISTGPHLDYRIKHNGIFKNPFGIKFKAKTILQDEELALFLTSSGRTAELLKTNTNTRILQVKDVTLSGEHSVFFL